jgi:F-type H+-transporting ATPase subunit b
MEAREIWDISWRIINFGIVIYIIVKFLGEPARDFLDGTQKEIKDAIDGLRNDREKAVAKAEETSKKLMGVTREIEEITHRIDSEAQIKRTKTVEAAKEVFNKIIESTRRKAILEAENAQLALREEVANIVVKLAEENIKRSITPNQHRVLIDEFICETPKISGLERTGREPVGESTLP